MSPVRWTVQIGLLLILTLFHAGVTYAGEAVWLLIDTEAAEARVMRGDTVIARYGNIAVGRRGTKPVHYHGDDSTPLGEFHIDQISRGGGYSIFLRLDYPTVAHARAALDAGKLAPADLERIRQAHAKGLPPPDNTPLGGEIGIHGIGKGSLAMHRRFNWTHGCVALDNAQIADLTARIRIGTRVVIR